MLRPAALELVLAAQLVRDALRLQGLGAGRGQPHPVEMFLSTLLPLLRDFAAVVPEAPLAPHLYHLLVGPLILNLDLKSNPLALGLLLPLAQRLKDSPVQLLRTLRQHRLQELLSLGGPGLKRLP